MNIVELRIHDTRNDNSNILIPFSLLMGCLKQVLPDIIFREWEVFQGAYGYGESVCNIESQLEEQDSITIPSDSSVIHKLISGEEYFNNGRMKSVESQIEIGIWDSTFLYLRGNRELAENVAKFFNNVEIVSVDTRIG